MERTLWWAGRLFKFYSPYYQRNQSISIETNSLCILSLIYFFSFSTAITVHALISI